MPDRAAPTLCLFTEASQRWGMGHLFRSLALAQAWSARGGRAVFCLGDPFPPAEQIIASAGFAIEWATDVGRLGVAGRIQPDVVVVDFPRSGYETCRDLKQGGWLVVHLDDRGPQANDVADLIVNPGLAALDAASLTDADALLGLAYAPLRPEFAEGHSTRPPGAKEDDLTLLVVFGGTDAMGLTPLALRCALEVEALSRITILLGTSAPVFTEVRLLAARHDRVRLHSDRPSVAELMREADMALGAAGTTVMELACLAVPQLVCPVVDGQAPQARAWSRQHAVVELPPPGDLTFGILRDALANLAADQSLRQQLAKRSAGLVDGLGAQRILDAAQALLAERRG